MSTTSDPAMQLHAMCSILATYSSQFDNHPTQTTLAEVLGVEQNTAEYFMGIGAIAARFHRMEMLVEAILDEPHKTLLLETLKSLRGFIVAQSQVSPWTSVRSQTFSSANMQTLLMASVFVKQHAPVGIPTPEERENAIALLDEALDGLRQHHGALSSSIYASLLTTKRMLERFDMYGVDSLSDELLRVFALKVAAESDEHVGSAERGSWQKAWSALMLVASMLVASDAGLTAIENQYTRTQSIIAYFATEQKRLPAPEPTAANSHMAPRIENEEDDKA